MKTNEELKEIAVGIRNGTIFTDRNIRDVQILGIVFMPLMFMSADQESKMEDIGMVYEYMEKASSRGINGYPIFMSMSLLTKDETNIVLDYYKKLEEAEKSIV